MTDPNPRAVLEAALATTIVYVLAGCGGGPPAEPLDDDDTLDPAAPVVLGDPAPEHLHGDVQIVARRDPLPPATHAGSAACAECHDSIHEAFIRSGHPHMLHPTGGEAPEEPWAGLGDFGSFADEPPEGYAWDELAFTLGGWAHKQRFVDDDGYILTGHGVQLNIESGDWMSYQPGIPAGTKAYNCGHCHNTGWVEGEHYEDRPGFGGDLVAPGVQCEQCHGPGSRHVERPLEFPLEVDDSAAACGTCHHRIDTQFIFAEDGFRDDHQQYNELLASAKGSMRCVDCHDPHRSALYDHPEHNPARGMKHACEDCHPSQALQQASGLMKQWVDCTDCHMPPAALSAEGDPATFTADQPSHTFVIETDPTVPAVYEAMGFEMAHPYLTLDYACRHCHRPSGSAYSLSDQALASLADGYHD